MVPHPLAELRIVRPRRLYEQIAEQVESLIRSQALGAGARLPSERELAEQLAVSRPSVREALIALETAGLIEVRIGEGAFVRARVPPDAIFPVAKDGDQGPGPLEQFQARRVIECEGAALAAAHATAEHIERLSACIRRMEALVAAGRHPDDEHRLFHAIIAELSRNSIFVSMVRELWRLRQGDLWSTLRRHVETAASQRLGIAFRWRLVGCLQRRDAVGARRAMERHFDRIGQLYFDMHDDDRKEDNAKDQGG